MKIYQFKAKDSKIKPYSLWSGNISKDFTVDNMRIARLNEYVYNFYAHYNTIDFSDNEACFPRPTFIGLNSNESYYHWFMISLDRFNRSCNTLDDPSVRIHVLNKRENVKMSKK